MTPPRRRTRSGITLAVVIAILTAIFASRGSRAAPAPPSVPGTTVQVSLPTSAAGEKTAAPPAASAPSTGRASPVPQSDSPGFTSPQRLVEHYEKHGEEFPGLSIEQYLLAAQTLRDAPVGGAVLEVRRSDGVVTRYDRASGGFLAANRDGTIRTFFRPNDGEAYFHRQAARAAGGGP